MVWPTTTVSFHMDRQNVSSTDRRSVVFGWSSTWESFSVRKTKKKEPLRLIQSNERIIFISQSSSKVIKTFYMFIKTSKFKNLQLLIFHRYKNTYKHVHMLHIWAADDRLLYNAWTWEFVCFCFSVRFLGERTNKVFFLVQREKKKRLVNWSAFRA